MKKITLLLLLLSSVTSFSQTALFLAESEDSLNIESIIENQTAESSSYLKTPCVEEVTSDVVELFYNTYSTTPQVLANDITIAADTDFTVTRLTYNFLVESGVTITNIDLSFYSDLDSLPGQLIETQSVIPVSNTILVSYSTQDLIQVVYEIDPVLLEGQIGMSTSYWLSYHVEISGGELGAVQATNNSFSGNIAAYSPNNGATWGYINPDAEILYLIEGECNLLSSPSHSLNGFTYYPNPVSDILFFDAPMVINYVTIFNTLGQKVTESVIDATSSEIDLSLLNKGIYFITAKSADSSSTYQLIKN